MNFLIYTSCTPKDWEFGVGFYYKTDDLPYEVAFMVGPFSLAVCFGSNNESR